MLKAVLRIANLKKMWEVTGNKLRKNIERKQLSESHEPPIKVQRNFNISKKEVNGYCVYIMKPLNSVGKKHILYLHGGGFVYEIMSPHWEFLGRLIDELRCTIIVPIYPLAPKHQCQEVFDMILPLYQLIISEVKPGNVVIMGDSAGGGMSLSLAQLLKEKELPQPGNIILISPTLDMTFSNPEIHEVKKLDPVSAVPALIDIVKWYSGEKDSKHYLISPIYGNFEGLGRISLFIGTHDILYPDCKKFKSIAEAKGIAINYYEYPSMIHVWPLFFLPESKKATKQIIEIIK
ncbi:MAG: alpha/beta hydrolase [Bacillota bacterium]|nr:alpha/beta hydrolase [Bacillota bacterium]